MKPLLKHTPTPVMMIVLIHVIIFKLNAPPGQDVEVVVHCPLHQLHSSSTVHYQSITATSLEQLSPCYSQVNEMPHGDLIS